MRFNIENVHVIFTFCKPESFTIFKYKELSNSACLILEMNQT